MAQQIKKKFIGSDQIDGSKIKLLEGQAVRGTNSLGQEVDLVKIGSEDKVEVLGQEVALKSQVDTEQSAREAGDQALQSSVDAESSRAQSAEQGLQSEIEAEESARIATDTALESRIVPMEDILDFQKAVIFENNSAVSADGESGVEDSQNREGWYYQNMSAGQKINWYFFDGVNQATIQKQDFSAYAVVTFDSTTSLPIMAVYTMPTGTNDVFPGFAHSRYIYSQFSQTPVVGKKYLIHIGDAPAIHPELPRIQVNLSNSQGEQLPTENVFTVSFGSNSGAAVGNVKLLVENLGVSSLAYKGDAKLKIKAASLKKLELEEAARIAGDESLQSNIDDVDGYAQEIRSDLDQEIVDRQSAVSSEEAARIAGDASLQSQINNIISNVDPAALDSLTEVVSAFQNADSDLQESLAALSSTASSALAAEVSRAQAAEAVLQSNIDTEESERIAADAQSLSDAKDYTDAQIAAIPEVKEVLESESSSAFPEAGEIGKIYVSKVDNKIYRYEEGQAGQVELPAMPTAPSLVPTISITSADDLQATINAASDGDVIFLANGTYSLSANLSISKKIALVGESQEGVLVQDTRGNAQSFVSVSVDDVTLKDMTIRHATSDSNIGHAIVVTGPGFPQARLNNFRMYGVKSQYSKGGLSIRSDNFVVEGCTFEVVAGSSTRRGVLHYGNGGSSFLKNNLFINSTTGALRAICPTSTSGTNPSDDQSGSLTIEGSTFSGNLSQFINMDNHQGAAGSFELIVKDNVTPETNAFLVSFGGAQNFGDVFSRIVLIGNNLTNNHSSGLGKGVLAIDGAGGPLAYRTSSLPVISSGNVLGQLNFRSGYAEASGSTGSIVGYSSALIQPTVEMSEGASGGSGSYVELSPTIDQDLSSIEQAIESLQAADASEEAARIAGDAGIQSQISQEVSDRISGDSALSDRLTALEADPVTKSYVDGEVSSLQSQINNVLSNVDPEALDSLTEIVGAFQTADSDILTAINNLSTSASSALAQEVSDRQAAVSAEESARIAADAALDSRVEALETAPVTRIVEDEKHSVTTTLTHVMLDFKAEKIFKVVVGRMNAMKSEDYSVSEEGGKTKLTWIGSFAEGGMEAIESGDSVFCTYSTLESMTSGGEEPSGEEPSGELTPFSIPNPAVWGNDGGLYFGSNLGQEVYDRIEVGSPANMDFGGSVGIKELTVISKVIDIDFIIYFQFADPAEGQLYFSVTGYPISVEFFLLPE